MLFKNLCAIVKHGGGSVLAWGCTSASGAGNLKFTDGIMDQHVYLNILRKSLKASAQKLGIGESFILQQDNDPKHTAYRVKEWIIFNVGKQLRTPPQSSNMIAIEYLWDGIGKRIKKYSITNKAQLKMAIIQEWNSLTPDVTRKIVNGTKKRVHAVVAAKGGSTKY